MMGSYREIVERSIVRTAKRGLSGPFVMPDAIREHQRHAVTFSLEQGCSALFLDTGLGKSLCAFAWAENIAAATGIPVLMLAPLGVVRQHAREAERFGYSATICREQSDVRPGLNLANYDRLHLFDPGAEKHLCPMSLNITKRALALYSNAGDVVFSPFGGIASEGVASIAMGRRFIGTELHPIYWKQGCQNLRNAKPDMDDLLAFLAA